MDLSLIRNLLIDQESQQLAPAAYCNGILGTGNENVARKLLPSRVVRAPVSQKYRRFKKPNNLLLLASGIVISGPIPYTRCLSRIGPPGGVKLEAKIVIGEFPLCIVGDADVNRAIHKRLSEAAFERQDIAHANVRAILLAVCFIERSRSKMPGSRLVEVHGRTAEDFVAPHAKPTIAVATRLELTGRCVDTQVPR